MCLRVQIWRKLHKTEEGVCTLSTAKEIEISEVLIKWDKKKPGDGLKHLCVNE
jgi:hypothetical protein